jgi:hypothetical protein
VVDVDGDLSPVVCEDVSEPEPELAGRKVLSPTIVAIAAGAMMAALCIVVVLAMAAARNASSVGAPQVPTTETTARLSGTIVSRAGSSDLRIGDHCEIEIVDSGDRDGGRSCLITVRCVRLTQRFRDKSCPIANGPVRINGNAIVIDAPGRRATFMLAEDWNVTTGGATLKLDTP